MPLNSAIYPLVFLALLPLCIAGADQCLKWLDPALQPYQDVTKGFPITETWYLVYRNYESDPVFGGTAKCVRGTEVAPFENNSTVLLFEYDDVQFNATVTLGSTEGYTGANIITFQPVGTDESGDSIVVYREEGKCKIINNAYLNDESFTYMVAKSQLQNKGTCCEFVYDLIAGTSPKYDIYDDTC